MDELSMIRNLLAEPPPSPYVVAEGRERLVSAPADAVPRTRPIRRAAFRSVLALGLTGAAAAAALAVATLVVGAGSSPDGGGSVVIGGSARSVLLAAAVQAESAPTRGTYWRVRSMSRATLPRTFGHGENRYTLEQLSVTEKWTTHRGRSWLGRREWVRPKTPEDEAAWQRDGAPSAWCIGKTDTAPPTHICLHTAPGSASLTRFGPDTFQITEEQALTFGQLQRLPRDPDALRAWLIRINRRELDPSAGTDLVDLNVENELSNLLVDLPVPPGVRAAAFRALADMPNVTSIGPTQDELGRSGVGIEIQGMRGVVVLGDGDPVAGRAGTLTRTLILDPKTSRVLGDETRVGNRPKPATDRLILGVGWTSERPHKPGLPGSVSRAGEPSSA